MKKVNNYFNHSFLILLALLLFLPSSAHLASQCNNKKVSRSPASIDSLKNEVSQLTLDPPSTRSISSSSTTNSTIDNDINQAEVVKTRSLQVGSDFNNLDKIKIQAASKATKK